MSKAVYFICVTVLACFFDDPMLLIWFWLGVFMDKQGG